MRRIINWQVMKGCVENAKTENEDALTGPIIPMVANKRWPSDCLGTRRF